MILRLSCLLSSLSFSPACDSSNLSLSVGRGEPLLVYFTYRKKGVVKLRRTDLAFLSEGKEKHLANGLCVHTRWEVGVCQTCAGLACFVVAARKCYPICVFH